MTIAVDTRWIPFRVIYIHVYTFFSTHFNSTATICTLFSHLTSPFHGLLIATQEAMKGRSKVTK